MNYYDTPIAHRGLHGSNGIIENTTSAFKLAIEKGYTIELDVKLLKDGKAVVFHDANLKRLLGKNVPISRLTSQDLEKEEYRFPNGEKIPTLEEVVALIDGRVKLLVELKSFTLTSRKLEQATYDAIKGKDWIFVQAFNPYTIMWFEKNAPEVTRGILATVAKNVFMQIGYYIANPDKMIAQAKPHFIAFEVKYMPSEKIEKLVKEYDAKYLAWTVKTKEDEAVARECGVDQIIFESIDPSEWFKASE